VSGHFKSRPCIVHLYWHHLWRLVTAAFTASSMLRPDSFRLQVALTGAHHSSIVLP
jgi:hypothetical protein